MNGYVEMWVDKANLKSFLSGKDFRGWATQSTSEVAKVLVPTSAISSYERPEEVDDIKFYCFRKNLW